MREHSAKLMKTSVCLSGKFPFIDTCANKTNKTVLLFEFARKDKEQLKSPGKKKKVLVLGCSR
jgi:hypothetical protein